MDRPNILLISFDDAVAPWPYKSAFSQPLLTPNLDAITRSSALFKSAYCQATVCGPSRASFMSGKSPHQIGIHSNQDNVFEKHPPSVMWSARLKESGYFCSSGGKVHHGYAPIPQTAHDELYHDETKFFGVDMKLPDNIEATRLGGFKRGLSLVNPHNDHILHDHSSASSAINFLNTYDQEAPFYREVGFYSPHVPFITPLRFKEMYDVSRFQQPAAWAAGFQENEFTQANFPQEQKLQEDKRRWWKQSVRNYFGAFSHGDYHLGRVWNALKQSKHAENTIVVILSDHGFHLGNRNRLMKTTLWEQVAHVPLIIHDPTRPTPQEINDPVGLIDVGPTLLDYLDLPQIDDSPGQSLRPYLDGFSAPNRPIPSFFHDSIGARVGEYRIIRYSDGSFEMFDLDRDYWQLSDLGMSHPDFAKARSILKQCSEDYGLRTDNW